MIGDAGQLAGAPKITSGKEPLQIAQADIVLFAGDIDEGAGVDSLEGIAYEIYDLPVFFRQSAGNLQLRSHPFGEVFVPLIRVNQETMRINFILFPLVCEVLH